MWLQGHEKKGSNEEGEKLQNGGIIEVTSVVAAVVRSVSHLVSSFHATVARENCNFHQAPPPMENHLSRCAAISPCSGPPPPLFPSHLISLAISIPRLDSVSQQLFLEVLLFLVVVHPTML